MIFHGNIGGIIQILTLVVAIERGAVYVIKAWKAKAPK